MAFRLHSTCSAMPRLAPRPSRAAPPPVSPAPPLSSACRDRRAPAATPGTAFSPLSSITGRSPVTLSRSCPGSMNICGGRRQRGRRPELQIKLPGLSNEMCSETMMLLFTNPAETCALVDAPRGDEDALCPEGDRLVAGRPCMVNALRGQSAPDPEPARFLFDEQQTQFRDLVGRLDQENGPDWFSIDLCDPAAFAQRVVRAEKLRTNFGYEGFKTRVPSVFFGVDRAVPGNDPTDVARAMASEQDSYGFLSGRLQDMFNEPHGPHDGRAFELIQFVQQSADSLPRPVIQPGECSTPFPRQGQFGDAAIGFQRASRDNLAALQALQRATEESGIETEGASQLGRRATTPLADLVYDASFLQGPGAVEQLRFDDAKLAGVEPAEAANRSHLRVGRNMRGGR